MTKVREFIRAYRYLEADVALGRISILSYAFRKGMLEKVIDEERQPVADKAAKIWDGSTASQQYLKRHSADIIEASSDQPYKIVLASDVLGKGWLTKGIDNAFYIQPSRAAAALASEVAAVVMDTRYPLREECADAVAFSWNIKTRTVADFQRVVMAGSAERLINDCGNDLAEFNAKREPVADAAWFLLNHGVNDWHNILKERLARHIIYCAKLRVESLDDHRQPVADAAQILHTVFGVKTSDKTSRADIVAVLDWHEVRRHLSADKAQSLYLVHGYTLNWLRANPDMIDESYARATTPHKRTRVTINRLGTAEAAGKVLFEFTLGGAVISSSMREGKICSGSPYVFCSAIVDFDSVTVTGDCDYMIERGVSE